MDRDQAIAEICVCGHGRHWHGQASGAEAGSGACDSCDCTEFESKGSIESVLARELVFALVNKNSLSELALETLEDYVRACRERKHDVDPEIISCLDGFRGRGKWPV